MIILAHGSRGERGSAEILKVLRRVTDGVRSLLSPGVEVIGAALQFNHPNLEEAVESLVVRGVGRIVIMPYFLFPGRHITEHIPQLVEKFRHIYPERQFIVTSPLGFYEQFLFYVAKRIEEAAPELSPNARISLTSPDTIEQRSMDIVEKLLPSLPNMSEEEKVVIKRVVHASGDREVALLIRFSPSAISSGVDAIVAGSAIFTDVRMVATGINNHLVEMFECHLSCALEEAERMERGQEDTITHTASAMRHLGNRLNDAIVAIGNAPTALLALLDLIDNREINPALVVGMPVGFVQAKESKDELMKRDIPYISVVGTRGGSAMAAATVNAPLKIAVAKNGRGKFNQ